MASYVYDDFRVTLTSREDGTYDVHAHGPDGVDHAGIFVVPLAADELERAVLGVAHVSVRSADADPRRGRRRTAGARRRAAGRRAGRRRC